MAISDLLHEQTLREILSVEPRNILARNTLARILFYGKRYRETLEQVQLSLINLPAQEEMISLGILAEDSLGVG